MLAVLTSEMGATLMLLEKMLCGARLGTPFIPIFQRQSRFYVFYRSLSQCPNKSGLGCQMSQFFQVIKYISDEAY
jgi:hypothetical protein